RATGERCRAGELSDVDGPAAHHGVIDVNVIAAPRLCGGNGEEFAAGAEIERAHVRAAEVGRIAAELLDERGDEHHTVRDGRFGIVRRRWRGAGSPLLAIAWCLALLGRSVPRHVFERSVAGYTTHR